MLKRRVSNKTYGKIDHKRLYRISTTNKVFSRADINSIKGYNIGLVVDCSGSMRNDNQGVYTAICAMALVRDFQKITSVAVLGFNMKIHPLKELHSPNIKDKDLKKIIGEPIIKQVWDDDNAAGNHDHAAVRTMRGKLLGQKGNSIMIVLSDGQPSCGSCNGGRGTPEDCDTEYNSLSRRNFQQEKLKEELMITTHKGISVLGIGIVDPTVRKYYKDHEVVNDPSELYEAVLNLFGRTIRRRAVR